MARNNNPRPNNIGGSRGGSQQQQRDSSGDLYQQLIDSNDLVKELDDIEAISQQISQHAEVLYQNWKQQNSPVQSPTTSQPQQPFQLPSPAPSPSSTTTSSLSPPTPYERSLSNNSTGVGVGGGAAGLGHSSFSRLDQNGGSSSPFAHQQQRSQPHPSYSSRTLEHPGSNDRATRLDQQIAHSQSLYNTSSPSSSSLVSKSATLPTRSSASSSSTSSSSGLNGGRSVTHIRDGGGGGGGPESSRLPLELLASPEVNGNLKDLVNSFVSTDRAKQAARQTISNTIGSMAARRNGSSPGNRGTSPFFNSREETPPLKSPMLTANSLAGSSSASSGLGSPLSPSASSSSTSSSLSSHRSTIHRPSSSLYGDGSSNLLMTTSRVVPGLNDIHTKMPPMFNSPSSSSSSALSTREETVHKPWTNKARGESISIPVQHLGSSSSQKSIAIAKSSSSSSAMANASPSSPTSSSGGLQSPKVLQNIHSSPFGLMVNRRHSNSSERSGGGGSNRNSLEFDTAPLPSLHAANVERMRQRFEEAKQRINLMHQRAMDMSRGGSASPFDAVDHRGGGGPGGGGLDDFGESSLMLEQLRRRTTPRDKPLAPHPELTPQQKQHIFERSVTPNTMSYNSQGFPLRRFLSGGSVAERVLIFERCPIFSPELKESRVPISLVEKKKEPAVASWRNNLQEVQNKTQVPNRKVIRDIPIQSASASASASASPSPPPPPAPTQTSPPPSPLSAGGTSPSSIAPVVASTSTSTSPSASSPFSFPSSSPSSTTFPASAATSTVSPASITPVTSLSRASSTSTTPTTSRPSSRIYSSRPASLVLSVAKENNTLPKFHFPYGNPALSATGNDDGGLKLLLEEFRKYSKPAISQDELGQVLKNCGFHESWKGLIFTACGTSSGSGTNTLSEAQFVPLWRRMTTHNHDEASQLVFLLTRGGSASATASAASAASADRKHLVPEDFVPLIQDVVDSHPGLGFLKEATEFHSRYVHTVIARIFFSVNRSWSGRISIPELRKSNFLQVLRVLEDEEDINQVTDFFSYEHFYVIYCKFWELDKDHDLFIDREDLSRHNDHAISTRMIDRIFSGAVTRGSAQREGKMSYTEFVWFLMAEEDKRHPTAIEYWFRCMDLDGDGFLSMYELEYFYEEQLQRMEQLGIETLPFEDCLCQMLDMIMPQERTRISLNDLKNCRMTPIFFDTFFNLEKYLDHEQRDPFASQRDLDEEGNEMSDWDRFAAEEYELLVAEEGNAEGMEEELCCDDDELDPNSPEMHLDEALDNTDTTTATATTAEEGGTGSGTMYGREHEPMIAN